jgi:dipeptidyl aminopeptidase/acylaminoacyl peptidase
MITTKHWFLLLGLLGAVALASGNPALTSPRVVNQIPGAPPLVPLERYLLQPSYEGPELSPDGKHIAVLQEVHGVLNLMIADTAHPTALRPLTHFRNRGMEAETIWEEPTFRWAGNSRSIFYLRDVTGSENWVLYSLDTHTGASRRLTPDLGVRVSYLQTSPRFPNDVLFGMNNRGKNRVDYYVADALTGQVRHVSSAPPFLLKVFDQRFRPRVAMGIEKNLTLVIYARASDGKWKVLTRVKHSDGAALQSDHINDFLGGVITPDDRTLLTFSSQGLNTSAWVSYDLETGQRHIIGLDKRVDVKRALVNPITLAPQAYLVNFIAPQWIVIDPRLREAFATLRTMNLGSVGIESRSRDDRLWIVSFTRPDYPVRYALFDRDSEKTTPLALSNPQLAKLKLSNMYPVVTRSSDGFELVSYIAYPPWVKLDAHHEPATPQPVITVIHGGPSDERPEYVFAPLLQWITNLGYTLFLPNFRGSEGFGKAFMNAQHHQWGRAMNRDVLEQMRYLIKEHIADPKHIAVFGGSYGGYETLVAMTKTPGIFACGADVAGPSNLLAFVNPKTMPPGWDPTSLYHLLGDPRTPAGLKLLKETSPLTYAADTRGNMLVVQGANDVRVRPLQAQEVVAAMQKAGVHVTYLFYPDEGHVIVKPSNNRSLFAVTEAFFGECLGGRYAALNPNDFAGSSVEVRAGAQYIPGLEQALGSRGGKPLGR